MHLPVVKCTHGATALKSSLELAAITRVKVSHDADVTSHVHTLPTHNVRDDACAEEEPAQDAAQLRLQIEEHDVTQLCVVLRGVHLELQERSRCRRESRHTAQNTNPSVVEAQRFGEQQQKKRAPRVTMRLRRQRQEILERRATHAETDTQNACYVHVRCGKKCEFPTE